MYAATKLDWGTVWEDVAANAGTPMQKSLVLVYLNGGNDGPNVTVPIDPAANMYPRYINDGAAAALPPERRPGRYADGRWACWHEGDAGHRQRPRLCQRRGLTSWRR